MMSESFILGTGRGQLLLLLDMIEDYVEKGNPTRFIDALQEALISENLFDVFHS
ncbi:MAG: hypothetical protein QXU18_11210 [Thermoplasmatales archaeon]